MYLFNKYGKDDSLYPKDAQKRAIVDQMLCFDMGTLFQRFAAYYVRKEKNSQNFFLLNFFKFISIQQFKKPITHCSINSC